MSPAILGAEDACLAGGGDADGEVCALSALQLRANSSRDSCGHSKCCKCKNGHIEFSKCGNCDNCKTHGGWEHKDVPIEPKCCVCRSGGVAYSECGSCAGVCKHKEGVHKTYEAPEGCDAKAVEANALDKLCGKKCYRSIERHGEHGGRCEEWKSQKFPASSNQKAHFIRYLGSFLFQEEWFRKHGMEEKNIRVVNGQWESKKEGGDFEYKGHYDEYKHFKDKKYPASRTTFCNAHSHEPHFPKCSEAAESAIKEVPIHSPLIIMYFGHASSSGSSTFGGDRFNADTLVRWLKAAKREDSPTLVVLTTCSSGIMGGGLMKHAHGMRGLAVLSSTAESEVGGSKLMRMLPPAMREVQRRDIASTFRDFAHLWYEDLQETYLKKSGLRASFAASEDMWCYKIKNFCMVGRC